MKNKPEHTVVKKPMIKDVAAVTAEIEKYSRQPFLDLLGQALTEIPTPSALAALASRSPVQWATYLTMIAKLAGFTEQSSVHHTHRLIKDLSQAELDQELKLLESKQSVLDVPFTNLSD